MNNCKYQFSIKLNFYFKIKKRLPLWTLLNLVFFSLIPFHLTAQLETANWYFGRNAGVQFNLAAGSVTALTDGRLNTLEGCASISDRSGNLLFYTDGVTVYNRNHQIMTNGSNLFGDFSSTQSAIIVPLPGSSAIYYIFTVDEPHHLNADNDPTTADPQGDDQNHGLNYSVVDMRLSNGLGAVVSGQKNLHLVTYNPNNTLESAFKSSEKITAVRAADCETFWIINQFVDKFYAFRLSATGIDINPVVSQVSPLVPLSGYRRNALGYLKASPDGTKLGVAHFGFATQFGEDAPGKVYLYDFDNATGIVSNPVELYDGDAPYGIEFSPDSTKMYASVTLGPAGDGPMLIFQYDLLSPSIPASQATVHMSTIFTAPAMQLGPDNKIYTSQLNFEDFFSGKYLSVIENPNAPAASVNFIPNGVFLDIGNQNQHLSQIGLPPFVQSFFDTRIDIVRNGSNSENLSLCEGESFTFTADNIPGAVYTWSKDDVLLPETGANLQITNVTTADAGVYRVQVDLLDGSCPTEGIALLEVISLDQAQNATLVECDPDGNGLTDFDLSRAIPDILNGITNASISFHQTFSDADNDINPFPDLLLTDVNTPTTLFARIFASNSGCFTIREISLTISTDNAQAAVLEACNEDGFALFDLTDALSQILNGISGNFSVSYYLNETDAVLQVNELNNNFTNTQANNQTVYARVNNGAACFDVVPVELNVRPLPQLPPDANLLLCTDAGTTLRLESGIPASQQANFTYLWSTGETTPEIEIAQPGTFSVLVTNLFGCTEMRNFTVEGSERAQIVELIIEDATNNNRIEVIVSGTGDYEFALDFAEGPYQDASVFQNVLSGFHSVFVRDKNGCGITSAEAAVIGVPKFFTPNGDGFNDTWQVRGLPPEWVPGTKIFIFDRYGKLLKDMSPGSVGWDGTYRGNAMPSTDYWYRIELADGRSLRGHFTLKR